MYVYTCVHNCQLPELGQTPRIDTVTGPFLKFGREHGALGQEVKKKIATGDTPNS